MSEIAVVTRRLIEGVGPGGLPQSWQQQSSSWRKKARRACQGVDTSLIGAPWPGVLGANAEDADSRANADTRGLRAIKHGTANWRHAMELFQRMPVDRVETRRLAKDPDAIAAIRMIDLFFEIMAKRVDAEPGCAADTAEAIIEDGWKMLKRGILRLYDPEADDDDEPFIKGAVTPGQRARARLVGAKLYAIRQHLRRTALRKTNEQKDRP